MNHADLLGELSGALKAFLDDLAAASSALSFLAWAPFSLAFLDLAFLGFFDAAMTRLPFLGVCE